MFKELDTYTENGHFFFERGKKLSEVCNAPEKPGVIMSKVMTLKEEIAKGIEELRTMLRS